MKTPKEIIAKRRRVQNLTLDQINRVVFNMQDRIALLESVLTDEQKAEIAKMTAEKKIAKKPAPKPPVTPPAPPADEFDNSTKGIGAPGEKFEGEGVKVPSDAKALADADPNAPVKQDQPPVKDPEKFWSKN